MELEEVLNGRSILDITTQEEASIAVDVLLRALRYKTIEEYTEVEKQALIELTVDFFVNFVFKKDKPEDWAAKTLQFLENVQKELGWGWFKTLDNLLHGIVFWDWLSKEDKKIMAKEITNYLEAKACV